MIKKINKAEKKIILELAKESKPQSKPRKPRLVIPKTDWEKLAKRLQEALSKEIKETDALREELRVAKHSLNARDIQFYKLNGIVEYLEDKVNGNN